MPSVGLCTLPTERMFWPPRRAASEMKRVRDAPHIRSIDCRASPAAARAKSSSVVLANACWSSPFGDGGEPCPVNGHLRVHGTDELECLLPDQFPFRIKVRCNRDTVGLSCQFLEEGDDLSSVGTLMVFASIRLRGVYSSLRQFW